MVLKNIIFNLLLFVIVYANKIDYLNIIRQKSGAHELKLYSKLSKAAKKHALYIAKNHQLSHFEKQYKPYFIGKNPWDRLEKVNMHTIAVNENLSFYNPSFKDSINQLMATIYHRLSLLDERVDIIGYARVKNFYVYELSNSKLDLFCKNASFNGDIMICSKKRLLSYALFQKAIKEVAKQSKPIIIYPYNGQKNVDTTLMVEKPPFTTKKRGFAISAIFNRYYFSKVKFVSFALYHKKKRVLTKIVTKSNDLAKKLEFNQVVLLPLLPLQKGQRYDVILKYWQNKKIKIKKWHFFTKN